MPAEKKVSRTTKPGPAAPNPPKADGVLRTAITSAAPQATAVRRSRIDCSGTTVDAQNWRIIEPLLSDRIRRRRGALRRLAGEDDATEAVDTQLIAAGDDAAALWRLAEQLDRRLDQAFARCARRAPFPDKPHRTGGPGDHEEFRAH